MFWDVCTLLVLFYLSLVGCVFYFCVPPGGIPYIIKLRGCFTPFFLFWSLCLLLVTPDGLCPTTEIKIYKTLVCPFIDYAAQVLHFTVNTIQEL